MVSIPFHGLLREQVKWLKGALRAMHINVSIMSLRIKSLLRPTPWQP